MATTYHIRLKGHLASHWSAWFENLTITNQPNGESLLCGRLADQAALHGVLIKIRDLGLPLLAVTTRAYERRRIPRTSQIVWQARRIGQVGQWQHPLACALRDALTQHVLAHVQDRQLDQLIGYVV